ncbi:hypothetical protein ACLB2K_004701 [Fragaria x ananassa]
MRKLKAAVSLITATAATGLTFHAFDPNSLSDDILHGVVRSSRAISTIALTAVDYKLTLRGLPVDSDEYRGKLSEVHSRSAWRILKLCEANKGFYVKAGQFVAALRQVPKEYSSTLSSLQDQVQYPGLEQQMKLDTTTMYFISKSITWFFPEYRFGWLVAEFVQAISLELDFIQEAGNSERTARNFKNNKWIKVPRVFWDLTTKQVLTMEFCTGHKVDDVDYLKERKIDPVKVAKVLLEMFAEMIFIHGFVHGDPHPGNILVSPEGQNGFSLVLLDHGIYKQLDDKFRLDYCQLWKALILLDSKKLQHLGEQFGVAKYSKYFPVIFTGRTVDSTSALGKGMSIEERSKLKQELKSLKMEDISSFMESLPSDFLTILRTDGLLRSIASKLGASQRVRILLYAKYALYGLSPNLNPEYDFAIKVKFSQLMAYVSYLQLRLILELLSWIAKVKQLLFSLYGKIGAVLVV